MIATVVLLAGCVLSAFDACPMFAQQQLDEQPFALTRLDLVVSVDYRRAALEGTATLTLRNSGRQPAATIPLLLNRLMNVVRVNAPDGTALAFSQRLVVFHDDSIRQVNAIAVTPAAPLAPGDSIAIAVQYDGRLVGYMETGSLYIRDHVSHAFTILRVDAFAFPSPGLPSWRANRSAPDEPFAFSAQVTVPSGLVVAMGGAATEPITRDSVTTWRYRSTEPVPFLNIAIAPYRVLERGGTRIFHFPDDSIGARQVLTAIAAALDRFESWYGLPGTRPELTIIEIPEGYGSQASLSAGILQTADAFRRRSDLPQLYHELSHLWNVPDLDRPSPRWNEGLASFLQWRMAAELDGWTDWPAQLERVNARIQRSCSPPVRCDSVPMTGYGSAGLTGLSYSAGLMMFYCLYQALGPTDFDRAYREFFQRYRVRGAHTKDLVDTFRGLAPKSERIFDDWLFTTRWWAERSDGRSGDQPAPCDR